MNLCFEFRIETGFNLELPGKSKTRAGFLKIVKTTNQHHLPDGIGIKKVDLGPLGLRCILGKG